MESDRKVNAAEFRREISRGRHALGEQPAVDRDVSLYIDLEPVARIALFIGTTPWLGVSGNAGVVDRELRTDDDLVAAAQLGKLIGELCNIVDPHRIFAGGSLRERIQPRFSVEMHLLPWLFNPVFEAELHWVSVDEALGSELLARESAEKS